MDIGIKVGLLFVVALLSLGIYGAIGGHAYGMTLAGAAVLEKPTQEQINGCMKECMRTCVTDESLVDSCRSSCEPSCGM